MRVQVCLSLIAVICIALCHSTPVDRTNDERAYYRNNDNNNDRNYGYYDSAGRYIHMPYPYRHVHDNRELGFYKHIPYPYDGGYGPYAGSNIPYIHDDRPYDHSLYTVSNAEFNVPEIRLEYGFPEHEPQIETHHTASLSNYDSHNEAQ